jgi:hypothetical protein
MMEDKSENPCGYTTQQVADALMTIAPAMEQAWQTALDNDELWRQRARVHGKMRTWLLRRQLRRREER